MKYPQVTSEAVNRTDRRNRDKLVASPGSYFFGRARELVLAAPYFQRNIRPNAYGGTATAHFHNLCAASYAMMLSAFEVTWKSLFAGVIDSVDMFDTRISQDKRFRDALTAESVLAHREGSSPGGVIASSLGVWQRSDVVNGHFESAFEVRPIANDESSVIDQLWQLRHVVAHSAGVVGALDSYRLAGELEVESSLQIDKDYLDYAEDELGKVVRAGVRRVSDRVLSQYFAGPASLIWATDASVFRSLFLLGLVVPKTQDVPNVTEADYAAKREELVP